MVAIAGRLDHELIDAVDLKAAEVAQHVRGLDSRRPHHELRRNKRAVRKPYAVARHFGHARADADLNADLAKQTFGRLGDAFRQGRQNTICALEQHDADIILRIDAIESVSDNRAQGAMQLGGKLGPGRAGADDHDVKLTGADRPVLRLGA